MNEQNHPLENELSKMHPRALDAELMRRIESAIVGGNTRPWADRLLLCAMGAGSLAACVIVGMFAMNSHLALPAIHPIQAAAQVPTIGSYTQALARADDGVIDAAN